MKSNYYYTVVLLLSLLVMMGCNKVSDKNNAIHMPSDEASLDVEMTETIDSHPGLAKYKEPIKLTFLRELSTSYLELISNLPDETADDNRWTKLYKDNLGIDIKYEWTMEGNYYNHKMNYAIASGQLTDVVRVNAEQLRLLNSAGLIQDLSQAYQTYATPFTKQILDKDALGSFEAATIEGRLMAIPEPEYPIDKANFIWIRSDWLDTLQLDPPQTIDDLNNIARAFTTMDPDNNGVDDTYGLGATNFMWDPVMGLQAYMAGYNAYPELWIEKENGRLEFGGIQPEVKDALYALQQLYSNGYIDEEFSLKNGLKVKDDIQNGKIGMFYGEQWASFIAQASHQTTPDVEWKAYPIVGKASEKVKVPLKFSPNVFFAVRKDYEYPEAVVKMYNLHLEKNWGEHENYVTYYSNPYPVWQLSPISPSPPRKNLNAYLQLAEAWETNDYSKLNAEAKAIDKLINIYKSEVVDKESGWGWDKTYGEKGAFYYLDQYDKQEQLLYDAFKGTRTETMIEVQSILNNLQHEMYINIILGNSIDEFDEFVVKWHNLGGLQVTEEVNAWHALSKNQTD